MLRKLILVLLLAQASLYAENITLCYHQFDYSLNNLYSVLPDVFEWQMNYLRETGVSIITVNDLVQFYTQTRKIGTNVLITIDDGWRNQSAILPIIQKMHIPITLYLFPSVLLFSNTSYFDRSDLETLKNIPEISFGCHSFSHIPLVKKSPKVLEKQVVQSKALLEKMLDRKIDTFAYPYGAFDAATQLLAAQTYKLCFGVDDGPNSIRQKMSNIRREVIYKTTTFGEFIDIIDNIRGRRANKGYKVKILGTDNNNLRYFDFIKVRLFEFPAKPKKRTLVIIPGSSLGAGWVYKTIDRMKKSGFSSAVLVERNNNIPFYRPDKEMRSITNWGLPVFIEDTRSSLDYLIQEKKKLVVLAWGDGFDILMATLCKYPYLRQEISGLIAVNPSLRTYSSNQLTSFRDNIKYYNTLLEEGKYATTKLDFFLKVKTLSDLSTIKPDSFSPFDSVLGYPGYSNFELLKKVIEDENDPDLSLRDLEGHYRLKDFKSAQMKPLPLFSMVVPLSLQKDLNSLWLSGFNQESDGITGKKDLNFPAVFVCSPQNQAALSRITNTFQALRVRKVYSMDGLSTSELLLSDRVTEIIYQNTRRLLK